MSLLQCLKLPVPKRLLMAQGAARPGGAQANGVAGLARPPTQGAPRGPATNGAGPGADPVRAEAAKLHGAIEARRKEAQARWDKLDELAPKLKQLIDASSGEKKKELAAKQALLVKKTAETKREIQEAVADLEAIESPGATREELVSVMARHRSSGKVESDIEVESRGLDPYKKSVNHDRTTTTSEYANGKATTEKVHDKRLVGLNGYDAEHSHEKVEQTAHLTQRTSEEKKTHVSLGGKASSEQKKTVEIELADGRKSSLEKKDAKEINLKGASTEHTETHKNFDGSSHAKTDKKSIEREDGKLVATKSSNVAHTDAKGTEKSTDHSANVGMVAKDGSVGAQGGVDGGKQVTSKGGRQARIVGGLHASVVCHVGEPVGEPKKYPVSLTVTFGASAGASVATGKQEGAKKSFGAELSGSLEASMTVEHLLTEEQLGNYEKNLQAASKGSKVAATENEFAIIAAGAKGKWDVARNLRSAMLGQVTAKTADQVKNVGDSVELKQTQTGSLGGSGTVGPVTGSAKVKVTEEQHKKVKRTDKDTLDIDGGASKGKETSKSIGLKTGAFEVTVGTTTTHTSSFGYVIEIDDKNDPGHKILAELGKCATEPQYQAFLAKYKGKVNFVSHTVAKKDGESTETGVGVAGQNLKFGTGQSISEEETRDGKGNLIKKTVIGEEHAGGSLGKHHDEMSEQAKAVIDGKGHAEVSLRRDKSGNDSKKQLAAEAKKLAAKVGIGDKEPEKAKGALATAAAEENDATTHQVEGMTLSNGDLKKIAHVAMHSPEAWMEATRRGDEKKDWFAACNAVRKGGGTPAATAEALARFVGGDRTGRMPMLEKWIGGGYHATIGRRFEFPEGLGNLEDDYNEVVADSLPDEINDLQERKGNPAAAEECRRLAAIAARIEPKLRKSDDFDNEEAKTEMLSRLAKRQAVLTEAIAGFGGMGKKADRSEGARRQVHASRDADAHLLPRAEAALGEAGRRTDHDRHGKGRRARPHQEGGRHAAPLVERLPRAARRLRQARHEDAGRDPDAEREDRADLREEDRRRLRGATSGRRGQPSRRSRPRHRAGYCTSNPVPIASRTMNVSLPTYCSSIATDCSAATAAIPAGDRNGRSEPTAVIATQYLTRTRTATAIGSRWEPLQTLLPTLIGLWRLSAGSLGLSSSIGPRYRIGFGRVEHSRGDSAFAFSAPLVHPSGRRGLVTVDALKVLLRGRDEAD